jgi:mannose-6-phosphate isomerase-like protein (cupin superfamily)
MFEKKLTDEDMVRMYANEIRRRLVKTGASIKHHLTRDNHHYWLVTKGDLIAHGTTPSEALDNFEKKLK